MSDDNDDEMNRSTSVAAGENQLGPEEVDPPRHFGSSESCASSLALASPTVNLRRSPLRSYHAKSFQSRPEQQTDESSFQLFASSFDIMSEVDHFSLSDHAVSPAETGGPGVENPASSYPPPGKNLDLALPELKRSPTSNTDSYSLSDISPIKVVYNKNIHAGPSVAYEDHPHRLEDTYRRERSQPPPLEVTTHQVWRTSDDVCFRGSDSRSISNPFYVLRSVRKAFEGCKYLLSCVAAGQSSLCPVHLRSPSQIVHHHASDDEASPFLTVDGVIAKRRVETAICAFGGSLNRSTDRRSHHPEGSSAAHSSIFRLKGRALQRKIYEERLSSRYYLSGSVISWELEEEPPIVVPPETRDAENERLRESKEGSTSRCHPCRSEGSFDSCYPTASDRDSPNSINGSRDEGPKMKYRCKLCGQLKQNHDCSYRHSLQRSIGVMVYPAVNAYTAAEPGVVAPALTEMNNFVSYEPYAAEKSHLRLEQLTYSSAKTNHQAGLPLPHASTVTPASIQTSAGSFHSPQSSLSHDHSDEGAIPLSSAAATGWAAAHRRTPLASQGGAPGHSRKRSLTEVEGGGTVPLQSPGSHSVVFAASVPLRPEHYRAVTPPKDAGVEGETTAAASVSTDLYQYPAVPLTFPERKVLSDSLFQLSRDVPGVTAECATLLREARCHHEWDTAVAELLAQVVVGLYCGEGDVSLDGLRQYLLGLGVAC